MKILVSIISKLPQNTVSKLAGILAKSRASKCFILLFAKKYKIDLNEAELPLQSYESLNQFFTRRLKPGSREVNKQNNAIISPVDGLVAEIGRIQENTLIQAKGINYELDKLIHHPENQRFKNGHFITVYLSPKDYHRIHSPISGNITGYEYVPGNLFPVNNMGVNHVEGLFTKNERLTTFFSNGNHSAALVKVGAFIVGSIQISYEKNIHQEHRGKYLTKEFIDGKHIEIGKEIGWFEFGSTVILLLEEDFGEYLPDIKKGTRLKMGETIGKLKKTTHFCSEFG